MTDIQKTLFSLQDSDYQKFQTKIVPGVDSKKIIGVRVPAIRSYAKNLWKSKIDSDNSEIDDFLAVLPHEYYEENLLHGFLLEQIKDFEEAVKAEDRFLPYIDNWAVCDTTHPKVFKKHTDELLPWIEKWIGSGRLYSIRYGVDMLMSFYLDEFFDEKYLDIVAGLRSEEYYVNMMRAWFFATALAKQWNSTIKYLETVHMDVWTHNKSIQKAVESYRITSEQKVYLKTLKISDR